MRATDWQWSCESRSKSCARNRLRTAAAAVGTGRRRALAEPGALGTAAVRHNAASSRRTVRSHGRDDCPCSTASTAQRPADSCRTGRIPLGSLATECSAARRRRTALFGRRDARRIGRDCVFVAACRQQGGLVRQQLRIHERSHRGRWLHDEGWEWRIWRTAGRHHRFVAVEDARRRIVVGRVELKREANARLTSLSSLLPCSCTWARLRRPCATTVRRFGCAKQDLLALVYPS